MRAPRSAVVGEFKRIPKAIVVLFATPRFCQSQVQMEICSEIRDTVEGAFGLKLIHEAADKATAP